MKKKIIALLLVVFAFIGIVKAETKGYYFFPGFTKVESGVNYADMYGKKVAYVKDAEGSGAVVEIYENGEKILSKEIKDISGYPMDVLLYKDYFVLFLADDVHNNISDGNGGVTDVLEKVYDKVYVFDYTGEQLGISNLDISYHVTEKETGYFAGSGNTHFCISCGARVTRLGDDMFVIYNNELGATVKEDGKTYKYIYADVFKYNKKLNKFQWLLDENNPFNYEADEENAITIGSNYFFDGVKGLLGEEETIKHVYGISSDGDRWAVVSDEDVPQYLYVMNKDKVEKRIALDAHELFGENSQDEIEDVALLGDFVALTNHYGKVKIISLKEEYSNVSNALYQLEDGTITKIFGEGKTLYALSSAKKELYVSTRREYSISSNVELEYDKTKLLQAIPGESMSVALNSKYYNLEKVLVNGKEDKKMAEACTKGSANITCYWKLPDKDASYEFVFAGVAFKLLEGDNQKYTSSGDMTFRSEGPIDMFVDVTVNGKKIVKDKDYTTKEGSTIVTLTNSYLATLPNGEHEVSINFNNGSSTKTKFVVDVPNNPNGDKKKAKNPNTVDRIVKVGIIFCLVAILMVAMKKVNIKRFVS